MDLERCKECGKLVAHIKYPWDAGDLILKYIVLTVNP